MEYSRGNKKAKPKVEMHDPLKNHSTNGIWKVKPYLHFKDMESFCNFNTSDLSKYDKVCTLDTFQQCFSPYCKKTHRKATYEEAKQMVNILENTIKKPG